MQFTKIIATLLLLAMPCMACGQHLTRVEDFTFPHYTEVLPGQIVVCKNETGEQMVTSGEITWHFDESEGVLRLEHTAQVQASPSPGESVPSPTYEDMETQHRNLPFVREAWDNAMPATEQEILIATLPAYFDWWDAYMEMWNGVTDHYAELVPTSPTTDGEEAAAQVALEECLAMLLENTLLVEHAEQYTVDSIRFWPVGSPLERILDLVPMDSIHEEPEPVTTISKNDAIWVIHMTEAALLLDPETAFVDLSNGAIIDINYTRR